MLIIPAIDILNGRCVRLFRGDYDSATVYDADPVETALSFERAGVGRIHIVDLDAARGSGHNRGVISDVREGVSAVLDVGGGVRTEEDILELLEIGIDFLVAGTVFARDPGVLGRWTERFGSRFIAGIDAVAGEVKTAGWIEGSGQQAEVLAKVAAAAGAVEIIYTDIDRDGTLSGPNVEATARIAEVSGLPVILSGGIGGMDDLERVVARAGEGIRGVITGKALYEGRIHLPEALARFGSRYSEDKYDQ